MKASVRLNMANWSYADLNTFSDHLSKNNWNDTFRMVERLVVDWDYDVDLDEPAPITRLPFTEAVGVVRSVMETINAYLEDYDLSNVKVDLSKMTAKDFINFNNARTKGDIESVERLLRSVVKLEGVGETLTALQGAITMRAFQKAYERVISGKN